MSDKSNNDLIVQPNEYAYIRDETKGQIVCYVGPTKSSLAGSDQPVRFEARMGSGVPPRFVECHMHEAVRSFTNIPEGWYGVLKNPAESGKHPQAGTSTQLTDLVFGRKVNIPGPASFALYPGQMAKVHRGHRLRSNQYLVARVYNDEAARNNISETIAKPATDPGEGHEGVAETSSETLSEEAVSSIFPDALTMGQLFIIKGTEVSFFIPPTGIEVVANEKGEYVQNAVTLEQLEYCILLDQSGGKRYERGPAVVFPTATETFVKDGDRRKYRAIELNPQMGLYIKVIADYEDSDGRYKQGDELFLTGKDTQIYFPRPEHALIKQGPTDRIFATAVPKGEGRYVLDKETGDVGLARGPVMLLPDPRKQVIVRRVLSPRQVDLWFPGNSEAQAHNEFLRRLSNDGQYVSDDAVTRGRSGTSATRQRAKGLHAAHMLRGMPAASLEAYGHRSLPDDSDEWAGEEAGENFAGDDIRRNKGYTPPRMITIDSKFDGAVRIAVRSGYAVNIVSKSGERKTIVGPQTVLLEYDEDLEPFNLSTGRPKGEGGTHIKQDVYLRVHANKVSDIISATTKDLVNLKVHVSYRVSFLEEHRDRWFAVENYTKLLCEHLASKIRNKLKHYGLNDVNLEGFDIIRACVLGEAEEDRGARPGAMFSENGMHIYDVEIFDIRIADSSIAQQLDQAQRETVHMELDSVLGKKKLEATRVQESIKRQLEAERVATLLESQELRQRATAAEIATDRAKVDAQAELDARRREIEKTDMEARAEVLRLDLAQQQARHDATHKQSAEIQALRIKRLQADTNAYVEQIKAVDPELTAKIKLLADNILGAAMLKELGAHSLLRGQSIADVLAQLAQGAPGMENVLRALPQQVEIGKLPNTEQPSRRRD